MLLLNKVLFFLITSVLLTAIAILVSSGAYNWPFRADGAYT